MTSFEYDLLELGAPTSVEPSEDAPLTFSYIFNHHARYVVGLVRRLGVRACDAEDVAQEVFVAVHAGLPTFERRSKLKTWLCGICVHKVQDYRRQAFRRRETITAEPPTPALIDTPHDSLLRAENVRLLEQIVQGLPDVQRQVFVLYEIEGLSMTDLARVVDCPIFTAYGRLRTARHSVRQLFERATQRRSP